MRKAVHLTGTFWNQRSLVCLTDMFLKDKIRHCSSNHTNCMGAHNALLITDFYEKGYFALSALFETHSTFLDKPLSRAAIHRWLRKVEDRVSDASSKSLKR